MSEGSFASRLSDISTQWTVLRKAHSSKQDAVLEAQIEFIDRYQGAIYRYLLGALRDSDAADEVFQEFAVRMLNGAFRRADSQLGRFRDYLKGTLSHMVTDHYRRRAQHAPAELIDGADKLAEPPESFNDDFDGRWREELLRRSWLALAAYEDQSSQPYYAVLLLRSESTGISSAEMAEQLNTRLKPSRPFTDTSVRKILQRAREKFAELLLDEVGRSLETVDLERIEDELVALELLPYCRAALEKRRRAS